MVTDEALRPFRSRRGRLVASVLAASALVVFGGLAVLLPVGPGLPSQAGDRLLLAGIGIAMALVCWRYATIRAVPTRQGLEVRNLVLTRNLEWAQIVDVEFGGGTPWVTLELDDTDTVAVMAIQRADGDAAVAEAQRLAGLVRDLGEARDRGGV